MNENLPYIIFFSIIPITSILLCFVKDSDLKRRKKTNLILLGNAFIFIFPLLFAYLVTLPDGNMWNENGPGVVIWFYMILIPGCFMLELIFLIRKFKYAVEKPRNQINNYEQR